MDQKTLWHETPEDALRSLVNALGGPKAVGHALMPDKPMDDARREVDGWCERASKYKPSLSQLAWLNREGRRIGCHDLIRFFAEDADYRLELADPKDTLAEALDRYAAAVDKLGELQKDIQRRQAKVADLGRLGVVTR